MATTLVCFVSIIVGLTAAPRGDGDDWVLVHLTGVVRDDEGQPIAAATVWWRDQYGVAAPHPSTKGGTSFGRGTTDAAGRYRMDFHAELGKPIEGLRVSAYQRGYVRAEVAFQSEKPVT